MLTNIFYIKLYIKSIKLKNQEEKIFLDRFGVLIFNNKPSFDLLNEKEIVIIYRFTRVYSIVEYILLFEIYDILLLYSLWIDK